MNNRRFQTSNSSLDMKGQSISGIMQNLSMLLYNFFFRPATGRPLAALRIGISILLLVQAYFLHEWTYDFFASDGLVQRSVADALGFNSLPNINWLMKRIWPVSVPETSAIRFVCAAYVGGLICLALGLWTRLSSMVVWLLHWTLDNSGFAAHYGIDIYSHIFLFYLMLSPCANQWSLDSWQAKLPSYPRSSQRFFLRIMQIHLCMSYLATGLLKAQGEQWWNGEILWRALNLPIYQQFEMQWLRHWPGLSILAGWLTMFLEIGYCIFIWPLRTRWFWIVAILGLHLGIIFFLGLHLFGFMMCLLTFCLFGFSPEQGEFWAIDSECLEKKPGGLIIFDGDCSLCNRWVRFVKNRSALDCFEFASQSSSLAKERCNSLGYYEIDPSTLYFIQGSNIYSRSTAVLKICGSLQRPWSALQVFILIPRTLRDVLYRVIARSRYTLFGKNVVCLLPVKDRFQEDHPPR